MPLHPQAADLVAAMKQRGTPSADQASLTVARQLATGFVELQGDQIPIATQDILVAGAAGLLPVRIYKSDAPEPRTLLVYFHGGGWTTGDIDIVDRPLRRLAVATGAVVASVGYRLAPETKFPGPPDDAYAAVTALAEQAGEFGTNRLVVGGDSAGGNLAAAVTLMARDRGGPAIDGQVLLYPVTAPAEGSEFASYKDNAEGYLLTAATMRFFWNSYVSAPADARHRYASPLLAESVSGLPPALVLTAEFDPLRDEGEAYALRLAQAGTPVTAVRLEGAIHAFFWLPGVLDAFDIAVDHITTFLDQQISTIRSSS